ncbi:unnamed protein product, partial [Meganyctiphanes norvegica]
IQNAGDYICMASNSYGTENYVVSLIVQDVPGSPHGLQVSKRGSRTLTVNWLSPNTASNNINKFIIQYMVKTGMSWSDTESINVSGETTTVELSSLSPATQYLLRVQASNHLGASPPSEPLQVSTAGEPPGGPPTAVVGEALTSHSFRVSWDLPLPQQRHGTI